MRKTNGYGNLKLFICFFLISNFAVFSQERPILLDLNNTIKSSSKYDHEKQIQIDSLLNILEHVDSTDLTNRYNLNQQLFDEYKVFRRDSAFYYAFQAKKLANRINDKFLITNSNLILADISVSGGMYKEGLDFLSSIKLNEIPKDKGSIYYGLLGRCYSDMAEYSKIPYFSLEYNELAKKYREKALTLTEEGTFFNLFLKAFNKSKNNKLNKAINEFETLLKNDIGFRDRALVNYMLGNLYEKTGNNDKAIYNYAKAAIYDIKTSTKESLAIIKLSELLFNTGDIKNASILINKANNDAVFYGAQQRKIQISAILPLIEREIVRIVELEKKHFYWQFIIVSFFLMIFIVLTVIIFLQFRRLRKAKRIIADAHRDLQYINMQLLEVNQQIKAHNIEIEHINKSLLESNKIKEEYLGFFFTQYDDIFEKFNFFKSNIEIYIDEGNYQKVKYHVSNYNLKREKEKLLQNFDTAFMKLFPNFIEEFNSLMKDEYKIELKKEQILTKELRIFALIRLGVKHNEIIAQILGYSVNSIYAYKTKIRNKSFINKDNFDEKLLDITTLKL